MSDQFEPSEQNPLYPQYHKLRVTYMDQVKGIVHITVDGANLQQTHNMLNTEDAKRLALHAALINKWEEPSLSGQAVYIGDPNKDAYKQPTPDMHASKPGIVPFLRVEIYSGSKYTTTPVGDSIEVSSSRQYTHSHLPNVMGP